jgi:L-lactate utilization protein LutB
MIAKAKDYANLAATVIKNMEKRQMKGYYAKDKKEALSILLSLIPEGSSIGYGGSVSLTEIGALEALSGENYNLIVRENAKTAEETEKAFKDILFSDFFLMSSNAITVDGELVNVDGRGNRVAFLAYGPKNVILVCGMNKISPDVDSAIKRIKTVAAPMNAVRLNRSTPCAVTGICGDCQSPDCICSNTVITRRSHINGRINVILVGEELGF